jgi:imidazolonepropionase-like amidohydrolase
VFAIPITSGEQARVVVDSLIRRGVDFVKVYGGLSREAYFAVAEATRERGVPFAGHVPGAIRPIEAAEAGQRSIEHLSGLLEACTPGASDIEAEVETLMGSDLPADSVRVAVRALIRDGLATYSTEHCAPTIESFVDNETHHVPTLVVLRGLAKADDPSVVTDPRRRYIPDKILSRWEPRRDVDYAIAGMIYDKRVEIVGDLHRSGVTIMTGTDASDETNVFPGSSLHDELSLLVEAGLEPMEALQAATSSPANFLGHADSLGTIEVGKLADLLLLDADPLEDIRNTQRIAAVILDGKLLDRDDLDALLAEAEAVAKRSE